MLLILVLLDENRLQLVQAVLRVRFSLSSVQRRDRNRVVYRLLSLMRERNFVSRRERPVIQVVLGGRLPQPFRNHQRGLQWQSGRACLVFVFLDGRLCCLVVNGSEAVVVVDVSLS